MGNEVVSTAASPADGPRDLAWLARNPSHWRVEGALEAAGGRDPATIGQALSKIETALAPVPVDPVMRGEWKSAMDERLRQLAIKVSPGMSVAQADPWRDVMAEALSDLPALVALTAAKRALHRPMKFMNEIEGVVREIAAEIEGERREAKWRLERLRADMERIASPPVALPAPEAVPMTAADIDEANALFQRLGIRTRYRLDGTSYEVEPPAQDERGNEISDVEAKAA